jgi:N-acyl homoserine lactone hydrolase
MRMYFLDFGSVRPVAAPDQVRSQRGYLIQTDDGENILIDLGVPSKYRDDLQLLASQAPIAIEPHLWGPGYDVPGQLQLIGLTPADLDLVVITHSDLDHLGGIEYIPGHVPVLMSKAERAVDVPGPNNPGAYDSWPEREYVLVDHEDQDLRPGIRLLATPGHTPGHFSVLVDLPHSGRFVLAADAIKMRDEIPTTGTDVQEAQAAAARLRALAAETGATLVHGHDGTQWYSSLRRAPEYYD